MMEFVHKSVLLDETVGGLSVHREGIYVDGTLGGGGHSSEICRRLAGTGRLIGIDQDDAAIRAASERLQKVVQDIDDGGTEVTVVRDNFVHLPEVLDNLGVDLVDGIMLDLGVSSHQLDNAERGFTYREDVPLDMRMDRRSDRTARDIVNEYSEDALYRMIRDYGEDKFAKNIAKHIVMNRQKKPIETTWELVEIIKAAIPMKVRAV